MDDLISRRDAIDALWKISSKTGSIYGTSAIFDAVDVIKAQPSAQRTGEWIMHLDDLFPVESTMECSQCHKHQPITIDNNFCPNCGSYNGSEL